MKVVKGRGYAILNCDVLEGLSHIPDNSVQCVVTSPPYWGLRAYGTNPQEWDADPACEHEWGFELPCHHPGQVEQSKWRTAEAAGKGQTAGSGQFCQKCGAWRGELGLEPTPELYVQHLTTIFREVRRVLRSDGTLWLNLGDSYYGAKGNNGSSKARRTAKDRGYTQPSGTVQMDTRPLDLPQEGLKPKDLVGIPWRVAFALQADGWWLRQDIIWCLSGGTWVYVKSQKGAMPMMVKDLYRLNPSTLSLWNGKKWTQVLGVSRSSRNGEEIQITLRSGERISGTPNHNFPTQRGLVPLSDIRCGDKLISCRLPEPETPKDCTLDEDAAWFAGLYLAEGSMAGDTIQIAGHAKEVERWERLQKIATKYAGYATITVQGNLQNIRMYGKILRAILAEMIEGKDAYTRTFSSVVWRYSNSFIASMLEGYLEGDGHWDQKNQRWRLGFCRNYNLERDLRVACARLGYHLILNKAQVRYQKGVVPSFRGEIRKTRSGYRTEQNPNEVIKIEKSRCRYVYDIGVVDEPHLFSLASGILTHNSKPNPMPESIEDRCTKAHEYVFLLTKSQKYFYDHEAVKEPAVTSVEAQRIKNKTRHEKRGKGDQEGIYHARGEAAPFSNPRSTRNRRSVWTIPTKPFRGAHFAVMPPDLVEPCVLAGTSEAGCCAQCGAPYKRVIEKTTSFEGGSGRAGRTPYEIEGKWGDKRSGKNILLGPVVSSSTLGWVPTCSCGSEDRSPCIVLDPFNGAATTGLVALQHGRRYIGIELNPEYVEISRTRLETRPEIKEQKTEVDILPEQLILPLE